MSLGRHSIGEAREVRAGRRGSLAAVLTALLGTLVLTACGAARSGAGAPSPAPTPSAVLTEADSGGTVQALVGDRIALRLSSRYVWSEPRVDGDAVRVAADGSVHDPAVRAWTISVVAPGTATVTSAGRPLCSPGQMCPQFVRSFSVVIAAR